MPKVILFRKEIKPNNEAYIHRVPCRIAESSMALKRSKSPGYGTKIKETQQNNAAEISLKKTDRLDLVQAGGCSNAEADRHVCEQIYNSFLYMSSVKEC